MCLSFDLSMPIMCVHLPFLIPLCIYFYVVRRAELWKHPICCWRHYQKSKKNFHHDAFCMLSYILLKIIHMLACYAL